MPACVAYRLRPPARHRRSLQVWTIESTGEVFLSEEAYQQKQDLYSQTVWSC